MYRNGDSTPWNIENNEKFYKAMNEISSLKHSHLTLMGDLNYRGIDWEHTLNIAPSGFQRRENNTFIECVRDNFLFQHVIEPTRQRRTDYPSTLDLILSSKQVMVSNINISAPIASVLAITHL